MISNVGYQGNQPQNVPQYQGNPPPQQYQAMPPQNGYPGNQQQQRVGYFIPFHPKKLQNFFFW